MANPNKTVANMKQEIQQIEPENVSEFSKAAAKPKRKTFNKSPAPSPDPAAIVAARAEACLTQQLCANLVYTGIRRWQSWEAGEARMPPATWEIFLLKSRYPTEVRPLLLRLSEFMNSPVLAIEQPSQQPKVDQ